MKSTLYNLLILLGIISLSLSSCKKEEEIDENTLSAQDNALADNTFADAFVQVDEASRSQSGLNRSSSPDTSVCPEITVSPTDSTFPKTITIDFGTGCEKNGVIRKGKIIAVLTGKYRAEGTTISISFDNYYMNDHKIEGNKTIKNEGRNDAGNQVFSVKVEKAKILASGKTVQWESVRINEWISGETTATILDDIYSISGSASGTNKEGQTFSATILENLIKKISCRWIVKGKLELKPANKQARIINYGNGDCDNKATVTIGNKNFEITLK